jgi:ubiquitin-conjugating enzyme E2 J1
MNPNIAKRLQKEAEDNKKPGENFYIQPLESNMYEWHFTLKGVVGSDFEGGIFHGHLKLPCDYPLNPPDIYFHNDNGRFAKDTKICLNITGYHKESWSPIWSIRKMMEALCAYMLVDEWGIGSLREPPAERKKHAKNSRQFTCKTCGPLTKIETIISGGFATVVAKEPEAKAVNVVKPSEEKVAEQMPPEEKKGDRGKKKEEPVAVGKRAEEPKTAPGRGKKVKTN